MEKTCDNFYQPLETHDEPLAKEIAFYPFYGFFPLRSKLNTLFLLRKLFLTIIYSNKEKLFYLAPKSSFFVTHLLLIFAD